MAKPIRIGLIGAGGRMGRAIDEMATAAFSKTASIALRLDRDDVAENFGRATNRIDVVIDVSSPAAAEGYLRELAKTKSKTPYVIGCTGWTDAQLKSVRSHAKSAAVVLAPNFSPGVNLFLGLLDMAAPILAKWGYDASIHEVHHTRKLDAPSGTAKAIAEAIAALKPQIHSTRAGNVVGIHEVRFFGASDSITLEHEALDRTIFARGALMAALWASKQRAGLFTMREVVFGSD